MFNALCLLNHIHLYLTLGQFHCLPLLSSIVSRNWRPRIDPQHPDLHVDLPPCHPATRSAARRCARSHTAAAQGIGLDIGEDREKETSRQRCGLSIWTRQHKREKQRAFEAATLTMRLPRCETQVKKCTEPDVFRRQSSRAKRKSTNTIVACALRGWSEELDRETRCCGGAHRITAYSHVWLRVHERWGQHWFQQREWSIRQLRWCSTQHSSQKYVSQSDHQRCSPEATSNRSTPFWRRIHRKVLWGIERWWWKRGRRGWSEDFDEKHQDRLGAQVWIADWKVSSYSFWAADVCVRCDQQTQRGNRLEYLCDLLTRGPTIFPVCFIDDLSLC